MRSKYVRSSVIVTLSAALISGCGPVAAEDQARPTNPLTAQETHTPTTQEPKMTPTPPPQMDSGGTVEGWTGTIVDLPAGDQFGQEFVRQDGQSFHLGTPTDAVRDQIVEARSTGAEVRVWGTLHTSPSEGEAQTIVLDRVELVAKSADEGEPVEGWTGTIVDLPAGNQFGQEFVRQDGEEFHLGTPTDEIRQQVVEARSTGAEVRVWGTLHTSPSEGEAQAIVLDRVEFLSQSNDQGEPVEGWLGTIYKLPPGNQFGQTFVRDDGEQYDVGTSDEALRAAIADAAWNGAHVSVDGRLYIGVPAGEARHIEVEELTVVSLPAPEPRDLTPFAEVSASSSLPGDQYGTYSPYQAVDRAEETSWVEGSSGPGLGQWIELLFPDAFELHALALDVGFDAGDDLFDKNNRIKCATVLFSNGEQTSIEFDDVRGLQQFAMVRAPGPNVKTTSVRVIIDEVYPGSRYDDTCLAEIQVWGVVH